MKKYIGVLFIVVAFISCGPAYDDGTDDGRFVDWGYTSSYRGKTGWVKDSIYITTKMEIAKNLVEAMNYSNTVFNNSITSINTNLLIDNVSYSQYIKEEGSCVQNKGTKEYRAESFNNWGNGIYIQWVKYNSFCDKSISLSGNVITSGEVYTEENFIGAGTGATRSIYSEATLDNLSVAINTATTASYKLYGLLVKESTRRASGLYDNIDEITKLRLALDMPKAGAVYRFDFHYQPTGGRSKYIEFYDPNYGYVTVDMTNMKNDTVGTYDEVTMNFADNKTCIFTRFDIQNEKGDHWKWFNCKKKEYEPKY